jgi:hypothetical protein
MLGVAIAAMLTELLCSNISRAAEINARISIGYKHATPTGVEYMSSTYYAPFPGVGSTYDTYW